MRNVLRRGGWIVAAAALAALSGPGFLTGVASAALGGLPPVAKPTGVYPPLIKAWEFEGKGHCEATLSLESGKIAFGAENAYGVVDLETGKPVWMRSFKGSMPGIAFAYDGTDLYALVGDGKLVACDPKTGARRWSLPLQGHASTPVLDHGTMFASLRTGEISAIDLKTHRVLWTRGLFAPPAPTEPLGQGADVLIAPQITNHTVIAGGKWSVAAFDAATGRRLWRHAHPTPKNTHSEFLTTLCSDGQKAYCLWGYVGVVDALELRTGRAAWRWSQPYFAASYSSASVVGKNLVTFADDGTIRALDRESGHLQWAREVARTNEKDSTPWLSAPLRTAGSHALIADEKNLNEIDLATGAVKWSYDLDQAGFYPTACYAVGQRIVIATGDGLVGFRPGRPAPLPTAHAARLAAARRLAARIAIALRKSYEESWQTEDAEYTLLKYSPEGFEAFFPYLKAVALRSSRTSADDVSSPTEFNTLKFAPQLMQPGDIAQTQMLLGLVRQMPIKSGQGSVRPGLIGLLAEKGEEKLILPLMLEEAGKITATNWGSDLHIPLERVCRSSDPRAVHFLFDKLADPHAAPEVRAMAYSSLAGTGGAAGVAAVRAIRERPEGRLPSFHELMRLDRLGTAVSPKPDPYGYTDRKPGQARATLLATHTDSRGIVWGLITAPVLGSEGDLWIVPRTAQGKWGEPIFTGGYTKPYQAFRRAGEPYTDGGLSLAQFLHDSGWVKFIHDPALTKDTDGDGWTDLIEKRLGTDPNRADMDGDGIRDSESRNPCGARPPSGEAEEILAAAFDASVRFRETGNVLPLLVTFPKGTTPFRLTGYDGIVIGETPVSTAHKNLYALYGEGCGFVEFCVWSDTVSRSDAMRRYESDRAIDAVVWNTAHTEATVGVRINYGGLTIYEMRLQKIDGRWTVVGSRVTIVP